MYNSRLGDPCGGFNHVVVTPVAFLKPHTVATDNIGKTHLPIHQASYKKNNSEQRAICKTVSQCDDAKLYATQNGDA